jgi:hypothetical protein
VRKLATWARRSVFSYVGSVAEGTVITFGRGWSVRVSAADYAALLDHFRGQEANVGTSRDAPPTGSVGEWLQRNVTRAAIASYVGPILVVEGYAERAGGAYIRFRQSLGSLGIGRGLFERRGGKAADQ